MLLLHRGTTTWIQSLGLIIIRRIVDVLLGLMLMMLVLLLATARLIIYLGQILRDQFIVWLFSMLALCHPNHIVIINIVARFR